MGLGATVREQRSVKRGMAKTLLVGVGAGTSRQGGTQQAKRFPKACKDGGLVMIAVACVRAEGSKRRGGLIERWWVGVGGGISRQGCLSVSLSPLCGFFLEQITQSGRAKGGRGAPRKQQGQRGQGAKKPGGEGPPGKTTG